MTPPTRTPTDTLSEQPQPADRQATNAVPLQMAELVLKTANFDEMSAWYTHLLGHGPFFTRTPDPDRAPRPAGMPERAVDVRLAFFEVHDNGHPHHQVLAIFGVDSLAGVQPSGPGLHHFQFGVDGLDDLIAQYKHMMAGGAVPHRTANHGQATSFYFRDPDANVIEFSCSNFPTWPQESDFMGSAVFAANPSGLELEHADFARRYHSGEPRESLLSVEPGPSA